MNNWYWTNFSNFGWWWVSVVFFSRWFGVKMWLFFFDMVWSVCSRLSYSSDLQTGFGMLHRSQTMDLISPCGEIWYSTPRKLECWQSQTKALLDDVLFYSGLCFPAVRFWRYSGTCVIQRQTPSPSPWGSTKITARSFAADNSRSRSWSCKYCI